MLTSQNSQPWFLAAVAVALIAASETHAVSGADNPAAPVSQVTLYRGQALVTRTVPVEGPAGPREIVVGDLPEQMLAESLFAEGTEGVEVRAARFRTRAVGSEPREEVRKLDEAIKQATQQVLVNKKSQELLGQQTKYLDQLDGFVAPTAKSDLAHGVLNAEALQKVTLFSFEQRKTLVDKGVTLEQESQDVNEQLALLQRKRAELTSGASRTVREAVLFLEKRQAARESVRLSYLVGDCDWSPAYTLRAGADRQEVRLECHGLIRQRTGEDWNGVQLTLSTASPALNASGPVLASFPVALNKQAPPTPPSAEDLTKQLDAVRGRLEAAMAERGAAADVGEKARGDWPLNAAANEFQNLELISGKDLVSSLRSGEAEQGQGPSLSYVLKGPVSVASRADQQMVQIFQTRFEGRFYHLATPLLTRHVYREAGVINSGDQELLAGPVSAYLDGRFVGRGQIPTIARGQLFVAPFGADPQVRARRELVDKTETVQGGNRRLEFKYRLTVENYTPQPLPVRMYDRLPHSGDSTEIRVTLAELKTPLSDNALYLRRQRPKGILRWELEVAPGAVREKAQTLEFGFSIEFDRNAQLNTLASRQQQAEFDQLRRFQAAPASEARTSEPPAPTPDRP